MPKYKNERTIDPNSILTIPFFENGKADLVYRHVLEDGQEMNISIIYEDKDFTLILEEIQKQVNDKLSEYYKSKYADTV